MELIQKIKEAEVQAQRILEDARVKATSIAEDTAGQRQQLWEQAQQHRRQVLEEAVATARAEGLAEAETLMQQAQTKNDDLRRAVIPKMPQAVAKVMEFVKG